MRRFWRAALMLLTPVSPALMATAPSPAAPGHVSARPTLAGFNTTHLLHSPLIVLGRGNSTTVSSLSFRLPDDAAQGPSRWYVADLLLMLQLDNTAIHDGEAEVRVLTDKHAAVLIRLLRQGSTVQWSHFNLFRGAGHGVLRGPSLTLHIGNYLQSRGVLPGVNTLDLEVRQRGGRILNAARLLPGSRIAVGPTPPPDLPSPPAPARRTQAPHLGWLASLGTWNYDFFEKTTDEAGAPTGTTDNPVNLIFTDNATVARIRTFLRPRFACHGHMCGSVDYEEFRAGPDRLLWHRDRGIKTDASYRCPDRRGGPADYHLRLFPGAYSYQLGYVVVGTVHIDCEAALEYGWQETGERMVAGLFSRSFAVRRGALDAANPWLAGRMAGYLRGTWRQVARSQHCMESEGKATVIDIAG